MAMHNVQLNPIYKFVFLPYGCSKKRFI